MKVETFTVTSRGIGLPDYSSPKPVGQVPIGRVYTLTDLAELAARLGSINTFDRRGNVIWVDDFEGALKWYTAGIGTVEISTERARSGSFSCKLTCDSGLGDTAQISRYLGFPLVSTIGSEISFTLTPNIDILFSIWLDTGVNFAGGQIKYDVSEKKLYYMNPDGITYTQFASDVFLYISSYAWHTAKLVIDFLNNKYLRFILDNREYDLSSYSIFGNGTFLGAALYTHFLIENKQDVTTRTVYADDAIITQNEPENTPTG